MGTLVIEQFERETVPPARQFPTFGIFKQYLIVAVWFGLVAGLLDGAELLLFQRINWEQWGRLLHVSRQIIWIDPLVDTVAFAIISLFLVALSWVLGMNRLQVIIWILTFFAIYDLLSATGRLTFIARLLLATGAALSVDRWVKFRQEKALRFWSRSCPWVLALWLLIFAGIQGGSWLSEAHEVAGLPRPAAGTPNIVLIVVDTLRADHLSAYGYSRQTTPNLDRIANEGVLFENAISASSWTFPSHASILTGKYPSEHGLQDLTSMRLGAPGLLDSTTLGEALQARGYRTAAFSANHDFFTSNVGLGKGFIHFEDYFYSPEDMFVRTSLGCLGLAYVSDCGFSFKSGREVNHEALQWIDKDQRPFLAVLNYIGVHESDARRWERVHPFWGKINEIDRYDSALAITDSVIGTLFKQLQVRGLASNTLLIVTSDHGQSLGQHHLISHGSSLYLEQIHVPLIVWYPGRVPAAMRIARPVSNASISATIMKLIGSDNRLPGSDLSTLWSGDSPSVYRPNPISEVAKIGCLDSHDMPARSLVPTPLEGAMKSIITPRWHLIEHQTLGKQLYDWVNDPGELTNLVDTRQGAEVARDLELEMQTDKSP